jgi:penicillin-binding protein 2
MSSFLKLVAIALLPLLPLSGLYSQEVPAATPVEPTGEVEVVPAAIPVIDPEQEVPAAIPISIDPKMEVPAGEPIAPPKPAPSVEPEIPTAKIPPLLPDIIKEEEKVAEKPQPKIDSSWQTRTEARTISLRIPGPRGQITDRRGRAMAQNRIGYQLAVKLPNLSDKTDANVINFARQQIRRANVVLDEGWNLKDEDIIKHFKNRRWLPLTFSAILTESQIDRIDTHLTDSLIKFPSYLRHYPLAKGSAHILGYVGVEVSVPTGPISSGDPVFAITKGRDGLELSFDEQLSGTSGEVNFLFDADGKQLSEDILKKPVPGNNIITTIDLDMQEYAEQLLRESGRRGAFTIMDVYSGDVYVLASWPSYDINEWIPSMSTERFKELSDDPAIPMLARAFRGSYPPASTFKIPVALAALEADVIDPDTIFPCNKSLLIGDRYFHNWNRKFDEGDLNVVQALMRSCNTWFYKVGLKTGGDSISAMSHRLGLGVKTGLPLNGEVNGYVPNVASLKVKYGQTLSGGTLANVSIGQGYVLTSPIQIARMMASVANGSKVPNARLVLQIQDNANKVVQSFPPEDQASLDISPRDMQAVREGMIAVVNSSNGTAKSASNNYVTMVGKTGTGEWKQSKGQYVAWFAGYLPAENPKYAFALIVEGEEEESVGGGKNAAPIVGNFFNHHYKNLSDNGELGGYTKKSYANISGGDSSSGEEAVATAAASEPTKPITEVEEPKKKRLLDRLFKRNR